MSTFNYKGLTYSALVALIALIVIGCERDDLYKDVVPVFTTQEAITIEKMSLLITRITKPYLKSYLNIKEVVGTSLGIN